MRHSLYRIVIVCLLVAGYTGWHKQTNLVSSEPDFDAQAKDFVNNTLVLKPANNPSGDQVFSPANRILRLDKLRQKTNDGGQSLWITLQYQQIKFIAFTLDAHRLFNTNFLQQLHV